MDIVNILQCLLKSLPPSVSCLIMHVGIHETAQHQSEWTKNILQHSLKSPKMLWSFSLDERPSATQPPSVECFSGLVGFNNCIHHACSQTSLSFVDNFNLFWNRRSFFKLDRVHPNYLGSSVLAATIQHGI